MSNVSLMTRKYPHIRSCCLIKWQFFRGIYIFLYYKIESFTLYRNRPTGRQRALSGEHICVSLRQFFLCCALHWWMSWSVARKSTSSRAKKLGKAISGEAVATCRVDYMKPIVHWTNPNKHTTQKGERMKRSRMKLNEIKLVGYNRLRIFDVSFCVLLGKKWLMIKLMIEWETFRGDFSLMAWVCCSTTLAIC